MSLFSAAPAFALDVFRIAFGMVLTVDFVQFWRRATMVVGREAIIDHDTFIARRDRTWTLFQYEVATHASAVHAIYAVGVVASVLLTLGLFTKVALLVAYVVLVSTINRNPQLTNSGHALAALLGFYCLFSPVGASLSLDERLFPALARLDAGWAWAVWIARAQITFMYLASVRQKLRHRDWRNGTLVYKVTSCGVQRTALPMPSSFAIVGVSRALTYGVLAAEIVLPLLLWNHAAAPYAIVGLAAMHLSMSAFLHVGTFPLYAIAGALLFLPAR